MTAVVVFGVIAAVSGDGEVVWWLVIRRWWRPLEPGWYVLPLVLLGGMQGWALWQILRGRVAGQDAGPDRRVRRLRRVLYAYLAVQLTYYVVFFLPSPWWVDIARDVGRLALVVLFHRVLDGAPRALRSVALAAGTLGVVGSIGEEVFDELGVRAVEQIFDLAGLLWSLWMALILVAQARDGRWGRGTVWSGAASMLLPFLVMPLALGGFDSFSAPAFTVILGVSGARATFMLVWLARSAHDLAGPHAGAVPRRERPVPGRVSLGRWPLPVAAVVTLFLLPAADHARGPFTSRSDCERARSAVGEYGRHVESRPMTGETAFVCEVRGSDGSPFSQSTPDLALVAYGHRLCGVYTRNDPREIVRVRESSGVDVRGLTYTLDEICPRAAAIVKAAIDAEDREIAEREAEEQRMCDAAPRHRPLIRTESASVRREPLWTDYGSVEAYEEDGENDPFEDGLYELLEKNGLVAALPGHMVIDVHSDVVTCVTTETYRRRPPVETKGWHHVVEVGYRSPTGEIILRDTMGGAELPDLALHGRSGDYRIRVHYAWFPWKGEKRGGQRLLIMAYPGRGDEVVVHRKRTDP
ncbi:hypothetical protein [Streptosporangium roseum]|uniref:Uncharacterized protein n=1 Tax=Streptosporangium roseum (strain ATCC 12428 / DSM 43021 / JCM 3005 / KCTC 9067 / NCIMB 10171 / NRRL 2505 / NI 9100) TaxID=479432 RepID=D2ASZ9_STRRD|nr:hypothetical protein [Streptosporangium roseum]ACZ90476.1 hypothetical protein Sros_7810 [Streptosporangium roseum DSM 43021]